MGDEKVTYERLFNLSNYEHEKFVVSGEIPLGSDRGMELKNAAVFCLELEEEIARFRRVFALRGYLKAELNASPQKDEKSKAEIRTTMAKLDKVIESFKTEHRPQYRECKCYYCTHKDDIDRGDIGEEDE